MNVEKFIGCNEIILFGSAQNNLKFTGGDNSLQLASKLVALDKGDLS